MKKEKTTKKFKLEEPIAPKKKRRGKAVSLNKSRSNSCLRCSKFAKCKDKRRAFDFSCTRFNAKEEVSASTLLKFSDNKKKKAKAVDYSDERSAEYDVEKMIQTIVDTETGIPRDLKIDDRDIPRASNFYEFITGSRFLNFSPWAKQLEIGLNFFSDYCVAKGTKIFSDKGFLPIEELVEQKVGMHPTEFSTSTHMGKAKVKFGGITNKRAKCLAITTHNGNSVTVTPQHLIQVLTGDYQLIWKPAKTLAIGDVLVIPYGQNLWSAKPAKIQKFVVTRQQNKCSGADTPEFNMRARDITISQKSTVTPEIARLLGYLIADGSVTDYVVSFTNEDTDLLNDFKFCLNQVFPDCKIAVQSYGHAKAKTLTLSSRIACDYLRHLGIKGNFETKKIPEIILCSNKSIIIEFIKALIDCDGFVRNGNVGLCMSNTLVSDVALIMQNLGIHGKLTKSEYTSYTDPKTKKVISLDYARTSFWWCASGSQAALYSELVGSNHSKKKIQCNKNLLKVTMGHSQGTYRPGTVPNTLTKPQIYTAKVDLRNKAIAIDMLLTGLKPGLESLDSNLTKIHKSLGFSEVTAIIDAGYHEVYDITVPGPESFVANGIVVHNCTNPKCSDVTYMRCIPVEAKVDDILSHCTLLINGICPRCKRTRLDLLKEFGTPIPNEMAGLAGQRCVVGSTRVLTNKGIVRIGGLATKKYGFTDFNSHKVVDESGFVLDVDRFFKAKPEKVITVQTANGMTLSGTNDHPIMTKFGFKKLKDIEPGEAIPVYIGQDIWSVHDQISNNLAQVLGFWVSEGTGLGKTRKPIFQITNCDKQIIDFCKKTIYNEFGVEPVLNGTTLNVHYKDVVTKLDALVDGLHRKSVLKRIPNCVLQSSKHVVSSFLQALYEGDGFVSSTILGYATISKILAYDLVTVLHNFGIPTKVRRKKSWATNGSENQISKTVYCVEIAGTYALQKFRSEIGFFSAQKTIKLNSLISSQIDRAISMPHWYEKFPNIVKDEFISILDKFTAELSAYRIYDTDNGKYVGSNCYSVRSMFTTNSEFKRIYADNVALSRRRVTSYFETMQSSDLWWKVSVETRSLLTTFVDKYLGPNVIWTTITSKQLSKKFCKTYDFHVPKHHRFMANGFLNHNSSKSVTVGLMLSYHQHEYLKMPNPVKSYGLLENTILHYTVTATTYAQAKETLYDPVYEIMTNSPWFKEYNDMLDDYGSRYGEELYKLRTEFVQYRHKNHLFYPAAPDKKNLRGRTRIGAAIDEIGWLFAKSESAIKLDPDEVYTAVKNSLFTVTAAHNRLMEQGYYNIPAPIFCNISSPSSATDKIVRLVNDAKDDPRMYAFHYSVYEMNPTIRESDLAEYAKKNPEDYKRDFLAIPPDSTNAFISNRKAMLGCIQAMQRNLTRVEQKKSKSATGVHMTSGEITFRKTNISGARLLALDAGWKKNSFAGAIMSLQESPHDDEKTIPCVEGLFELIPSNDHPINMNDVYENLLKPIIEEFDIKFITADRWNSLKLLQDIEDEFEIPYSIYSLTYDDFVNFRNDIYAGSIMFPAPEMKVSEAFSMVSNAKDYPFCFIGKPVAHFMFEALTVQDIMGKKVEKADKRTDDLWRAVALGHSMLIDEDVINNYLIEFTRQSSPILGVVGSYANASKNMGAMSTNFGAVGSLSPQGSQSRSGAGGSVVFSKRGA